MSFPGIAIEESIWGPALTLIMKFKYDIKAHRSSKEPIYLPECTDPLICAATPRVVQAFPADAFRYKPGLAQRRKQLALCRRMQDKSISKAGLA